MLKFQLFLNPELQLKDIESALKCKLIDLLTQLKGFKSVTKLILVFKKTESKGKIKYDAFYSNSEVEVISKEKVRLMICFNKSILQL